MPIIEQFDMPIDLRMEGPAARGTTLLSATAATKANISSDLTLTPATAPFTIADPSLFRVQDDITFRELAAVINMPRFKSVRPPSNRIVSGEMGVTDLIKRDLAAPTNAILQSIFQPTSPKPFWHGRGRGSSPIPDLELVLKGKTIAVLEVKTVHSLPNTLVDTIYDDLAVYTMTTLNDGDARSVPSLKRQENDYRRRDELEKDEKIVEQVC